MPRSEVNALTLVAIFIAAGILPGDPLSIKPLIEVVLLIVLFSFDRDGHRTSGQSLGFGAVAGFSVVTAVYPFAVGFLATTAALPWFPILWIIAALIFWAVDISRMGHRATALQMAAANAPVATLPPAPVVAESARPYAPHPPSPPAPASNTAPEPFVRPEPVRAQPPLSEPAPVPAFLKPASTASIFSQPSPLPPPTPAPLIERETPLPVETAPLSPPPPAQAIPIPTGSGKPTLIYLNLVGEGLAVLRSVQAEHLRKDYYLITEPMPPNENWEFRPGQVVRCQKRNLSSGKALVAVEEAPRAS